MSDTALAPSGSESIVTITVDGVPLVIGAQIASFSEDQVVSIMEHKPLGTTTVVKGQDFGGWKGTMEIKQSDGQIASALDVIEAATRAGLPSVVTIARATRYRDLTTETYIDNNCKISQSGATRSRGNLDTVNIAWESGDQRIAA